MLYVISVDFVGGSRMYEKEKTILTIHKSSDDESIGNKRYYKSFSSSISGGHDEVLFIQAKTFDIAKKRIIKKLEKSYKTCIDDIEVR